MKLVKFGYSQHKGEPQEWGFSDLHINHINLFVGRNATGKTKILNVIYGLARLVSGEMKLAFRSGAYDVCFSEGSEKFVYSLKFEDSKVFEETLHENEICLLKRGPDGVGEIFHQEMNKMIKFQAPESELAIVARRDTIQHPFFEKYHTWAKGVFFYPFGTPLGKDQFVVFVKTKEKEFNPKDAQAVVPLLKRAIDEFGDRFKTSIFEDMARLGYHLTDISISPPKSISVFGPTIGELSGISVKEKDLDDDTDQFSMSQGMFRALSILVQVNYSLLKLSPTAILIDDIGEGLDFERSCALIDILVEKAKPGQIQVLMGTNDRFVMNRVPLEHWRFLKRGKHQCRVFDIANSREVFEKFRFTGLSNFDFLASDFLSREFPDE